MDETIFLQIEDILISNARAVFQSQTYSMANITSVRVERYNPNETIGGCATIAGLFVAFLALCLSMQFLWLIVVILGIIAYFAFREKHYRIVLNTSAGEIRAYQTPDEGLSGRIMTAFNNAIVARG